MNPEEQKQELEKLYTVISGELWKNYDFKNEVHVDIVLRALIMSICHIVYAKIPRDKWTEFAQMITINLMNVLEAQPVKETKEEIKE